MPLIKSYFLILLNISAEKKKTTKLTEHFCQKPKIASKCQNLCICFDFCLYLSL